MGKVKESKEESKKKGVLKVHPLPPGGIRRSRRLLGRPLPTPYYGGARKPARRQEKGKGEESLKEAWNAAAGDEDRKPGKGSSEDPAEGEEAHPCLFKEDVLDVVFKHLVAQPGTSTDVQNCRLVCKTWKNSVTRMYRRRERSTATFDDGNRIGIGFQGRKPLSQFVSTMESSEMVPVQKYTFTLSFFNGPLNLKLFGDFLRICGSEAVSLAIEICFRDAEKVLLAVEEDILNLSMPRLKSLKFDAFDQVYHHPREQHPGQIHGIVRFLRLLLHAAQSLQEFNLCCCPSQANVMEQLDQLIARSIPRTLKQLSMCTDIRQSAFDALAEVGLKLERFRVDIPSLSGSGALSKFFASQSSTLNHVRLWEEDPNPDAALLVEFPRVEELSYLELSGVTVSVRSGSEFATTFPKLHTLDIMELSNEDLLPLLSSVKRSPPALKVIHLPVWLSTPLVKDVAVSFQFVVELHILLCSWGKDIAVEVFKYFDNLQSLIISFDCGVGMDHVDSIFTGISTVDCNRIRREFPDLGRVNLDKLERTPSLLNLTKLKKLVLRGKDFSTVSIIISDIAAQFAFLGMESLREIHLTSTGLEFSPGCVELLRDKLILKGGGGRN